ncbi:uncharacterized protein PGTG_21995 [Puccinia graminis f. sp. tritici CRL 75-36-700-3]|uniref:Reverse transcriptase domain-containing protein n=1 Tax=Puccinia graminis f. sp. tritici (strain CRL 75-36-700-3 / race SCCL) TaxID=418459 RepID=H6QT76_PUCGT|nr:uncharacterized protein PGTG_21995 [Puccinia graminis f. sp. tritici CRL 75-36-700-3]EHS64030.1 hypothetical protein PGTG_21995 [Puccinia graminis f. sp. tritici CRL 75-36-700-3]
MNIPEWEKSLTEANIKNEYQDVLDGFRYGFDQGIPHHSVGNLKWLTPDNHASANQTKEKIEKNIEKEINAGRMFGPFSHAQVATIFPFFRSSPMGAVVNGDGSVRPINDLSYPKNRRDQPSVNSFVNKNDFTTTWDDFNKVSRFFRNLDEPAHLTLFDWEKAYRQIPTAMDQWQYLMVQDFNGDLLLDTRITFGGVAGCGSFGRPADAWKDIMLHYFDLITVFRWVDDNLFVKSVDCQTNMDEIVKKSTDLGVLTNTTKNSPFQEEQKFIGFIWNGVDKTVRLPKEKILKRISQVEEFLKVGRMVTYTDIEILVGRLNHVTYILPQLRCYLCALYAMLCGWVFRERLRPLSPEAIQDLSIWKETLGSFDRSRLIRSRGATEIGWVGDASTNFGIGIIIGSSWAQFQLKKGWRKVSQSTRGIAWLETVAVRLGLIMLEKIGLQRGKTFIVWTDNTTSEGVIKNRKSYDPSVNSEWKVIQNFLIENDIDIVAKRVPSAYNKADKLSRGIRSDRLAYDEVDVEVPLDLNGSLFQVFGLEL